MSKTETDSKKQETEATPEFAVPDDPTPIALRSYGLSGEPLRMAPVDWQPVVDAVRRANLGQLTAAQVQPIVDAVFPDAGYQAADLCLASTPNYTFTATVDDQTVSVTAGNDGLLPDANVQWDFGDGTGLVYQAGEPVEHTYDYPGSYTVRMDIAVAGAVNSATDTVEVNVPDEPEVEPQKSKQEYDPGDHTVTEVVEYVEKHPDQRDAVIAAEEEGKVRSTLLEKLYGHD